MRITIVVGGRWHAFDLARELQANGHLYRLITNYPRWFVARWGIPPEKVTSLQFTFWIIRLIYKIGGEAFMMRNQWWVHQWFARQAAYHLEGSELIHGWSQWSEPSLRWAKSKGIPTVLERSSAHILEQSRLLREEHARLGMRWVQTHPKIEDMELREYSLCSRIAVPSRFVERTFQSRGVGDERLRRNALGVNLDRFYAPTKPPQPPQAIGLQVIYAGALSVQKGIPDLLSGFQTAGLTNATLTLIGGETRELKRLLRSRPPNIIRLGHLPQEELIHHYHKGHCFVIASIQEGMAMVQMQALACGLPLICTTHTGGEDLLRLQDGSGRQQENGIQQYSAGFVVPINRPDAIAQCLKRLNCEAGLWEQMQESAKALASKELSWSAYGKRAIELYRELIEK